MQWRALAWAATAACSAPLSAAGADWDDQAVVQSVERARKYLWSQWSDGHWRETGKPGLTAGSGELVNYGGHTALCAYALLAAGESPQEPRMRQTLEWLARAPMHGTYARALRASVWGLLGRDSRYRKNLAEDVKWLMEAADARGAYTYYRREKPPPGGPAARAGGETDWYDNSNSQFAVLGVWAGAESGIEVPPEYWRLVEKHWLGDQGPNGGWGYLKVRPSHQPYGSMSVAGLATLFICFDALHAGEYVRCRPDPGYEPITRGLDWLDRNFSVEGNPGKTWSNYYYYLYGVERVGLASGYKYFGRQDWYKRGAGELLNRQGADGGWGSRLSVETTCFALLFLARGRHPVLFNKLQYPGLWNSRPRDLAFLTRWISRTFERPVNWQIVDLAAPAGDLHDAPILYVSGAGPPAFSRADVDKLRRFVLEGGVIFSEAACSQAAFTMAMRKHYADMFPGLTLAALDGQHPVYNLHFQLPEHGRLMGVSNGVRLLAIHSPTDLSGAWQTNQHASQKALFELAANVYFFVTDRGSLRLRGVSPWPAPRPFKPAETVKVAVVRHEGNWNPEPLAWERFALLMGNRHRIAVTVRPPVEAAKLDPAAWPVAAMTGTGPLRLSAADRAGLARYLTGGGTLVVDAAGGDAEFAASAAGLLAGLLPQAPLAVLPPGHGVYADIGPSIDNLAYRRALLGPAGKRLRRPLAGVTVTGRTAIFFSAADLTAGLVGYPCWGLKGYEPETAFRLMRNIVLHASGKKVPGKTEGDGS